MTLGNGRENPEGNSTYPARLQRVLLSLAKPPSGESLGTIQFPAHAEDLAVDFDEAYTGFIEGMDRLPSESQLLALQAVDTKLADMIRRKDASLWTARAFLGDPDWNEIRRLAATAMGECE